MGGIIEKITDFIKELLTGWVTSNLETMFTDVNTKVGTIATEVGKTPQDWNSGISVSYTHLTLPTILLV